MMRLSDMDRFSRFFPLNGFQVDPVDVVDVAEEADRSRFFDGVCRGSSSEVEEEREDERLDDEEVELCRLLCPSEAR